MNINLTNIDFNPNAGGGGNNSGKTKISNGITLLHSTWTTFDMEPYDWSLVYDWNQMFLSCRNLTEIKNFPDYANVLSCYWMFNGCERLTAIPKFDTSNVLDMCFMFNDCKNLTTIPQFNTSNVLDMSYMFSGCKNLKSIPKLDTSNVLDMTYMFSGCRNLTTVRMIGNPSKLTNVNNMFNSITTAGTFYYPAEYAENYQKIINVLPSTWTAVGE